MAIRPIVQDGDPVLRAIAAPVPEELFGTNELAQIIADMADTLDVAAHGVAIAAPQIGVSYRIFLVRYDRTLPDRPVDAPALPADVGVFINPEFVKSSRKRAEMDEGCLSVKDLYGTTYRHERATVRARDAHGKVFERGGGGLLAQIFQHETDHLNGILFIDHAEDLSTMRRRDRGDGTIKFVFFGTPRFSAIALDELAEAGYVPSLIVTAPDKPAGRGLAETAPAVKEWAIAHDVPYIQPATLKDIPVELRSVPNVESEAEDTGKPFDLFIVAAYGALLRADVLALPAHGCVNLHPSLLPKFRGASPIESQILADELPVGVSVMLMDEQMDHGPIFAQKKADIRNWPMNKPALTDFFAHESARLLADILPEIVARTLIPTEQDHAEATFTKKIEKADGLLDLPKTENSGADFTAADTAAAKLARVNYLKYLAYEGWPGTYFFVEKNGKQVRMKVTKARYEAGAADGAGKFIIEKVIPEGKGEQTYVPN